MPAWYAMVPNKQALEAFNPPATYMWKAVADLLTQGLHMLPVTAIWAIVIGALVGVALPVAGKLFPKAEPYLPSAMGLGLSWVMVFQNSLSFAIGAVLVAAWNRLNKKGSDLYYVPVASGLIAGESLIAALIAIACTVVGLLAREMRVRLPSPAPLIIKGLRRWASKVQASLPITPMPCSECLLHNRLALLSPQALSKITQCIE